MAAFRCMMYRRGRAFTDLPGSGKKQACHDGWPDMQAMTDGWMSVIAILGAGQSLYTFDFNAQSSLQ